jgi:hypothetical protein
MFLSYYPIKKTIHLSCWQSKTFPSSSQHPEVSPGMTLMPIHHLLPSKQPQTSATTEIIEQCISQAAQCLFS